MLAKILPLDGKYYGTRIELNSGYGFKVWIEDWDTCQVSIREIENGWDSDMGMDHVEHQLCLDICNVIVDALNRAGY